MKKFALSLELIIIALCVLCCCTGGDTAETSSEESSNYLVSEESVSKEVNFDSAETSESNGEISAESYVSSEEPTSEAESSVEDVTSIAPIQSEAPSKEPETIPNLILGPQPENGEYHVLYVGESLQLYSQIEGSELEDAMLLWKVSDTSVLAFGGKKATALKPGTSTVTLSYSNGLKPVSLTFMVLERELSEDSE